MAMDQSDGGELDEERMLELAQSKLLIMSIADSEPIKSEYPGLYDKIDEYIEALVAERQQQVQADTLEYINALIDSVAQSEANDSELVLPDGSPLGRNEMLLLVDRILLLLQ